MSRHFYEKLTDSQSHSRIFCEGPRELSADSRGLRNTFIRIAIAYVFLYPQNSLAPFTRHICKSCIWYYNWLHLSKISLILLKYYKICEIFHFLYFYCRFDKIHTWDDIRIMKKTLSWAILFMHHCKKLRSIREIGKENHGIKNTANKNIRRNTTSRRGWFLAVLLQKSIWLERG